MRPLIDPTLDDPIFILAYMHSGTTLLQQILSRNSAIYVSEGETRHFSNLSVTRQKFKDLNDDLVLREYLIYMIRVVCTGYATVNFKSADRSAADDLAQAGITQNDIEGLVQISKQTRDYNQLYLLVFDFLTTKEGKKRWLDKLPGYVSQFDQIRDVVPEAKFIELVRDARDILASKKKRTATGGGYDPLWDSLAWQSAVRAGNSAHHRYPDRILRVKYEDLVARPAMELVRICDFLNLKYDENMLSVGWINTTSAGSTPSNQGISTAAVGKWVDQLPPADIAVCQYVAGKELQKLGYLSAAVPWHAYGMMPIIFTKSGFEFFKRLFERWRQGGFHYFLNVLSNYRDRLLR
jgi:hypothetical protein